MQVKNLLLLASFWLLAHGFLNAQDIHFTQFSMSPMTLNPANIAKFQGTVRVGGIYRNQFASIISNEYSTPSAWADAPIMKGFKRKDWIGLGMMFFQDNVGVGKLSNTAFKLGGSYHLALNKKATSYLTFGAQFGNVTRKTNIKDYTLEDGLKAQQTTGTYVSAEQPGNTDKLKTSFNDWDGGVIFTTKLNKKMDMNLGFAMYHLLTPKYGLINASGGTGMGSTSNEKIPRRAVFHGQFNIDMNKKWTFNPTFLFQSMSGADEIVLQALTGYKFNEQKDILLHFGIGYRMRDAANILLGMTKGPLRVGLAYDVNVSSLTTVSNYRGGWELAANYIFKIYKPAVVKPKILCPRF